MCGRGDSDLQWRDVLSTPLGTIQDLTMNTVDIYDNTMVGNERRNVFPL